MRAVRPEASSVDEKKVVGQSVRVEVVSCLPALALKAAVRKR
jgi:hypothetical protein